MLVVSNLVFVNYPPPQYKHLVLCVYFIALCACANSSFENSFLLYVWGSRVSKKSLRDGDAENWLYIVKFQKN